MNNLIQSVLLIFRVYIMDFKFISKEDFLSKRVVSETTCFEKRIGTRFEINYFQAGCPQNSHFNSISTRFELKTRFGKKKKNK